MKEVGLTEEEVLMANNDHKTLTEILNSQENLITGQEYGTKKVKYWYGFFMSPANIENLAENLGEAAIYQIVFKPLSSFIHGEDIIHNNMIFGEGEQVGIKSLRDISQLDFVMVHTSIILKRTIGLFIEKKIENDLKLLAKLHLLWMQTGEFRK